MCLVAPHPTTRISGAWDNRVTPGNISTANSDFLSIVQGNTAGSSIGTASSGLPASTGTNYGPFTTVPTRTAVSNIPAVAFDYRTYNNPQRLGTLANNALFNGIYGNSNWTIEYWFYASGIFAADCK